MSKSTETLNLKQDTCQRQTWHEVSWNSANSTILLDTQDGLWHLGPVTRTMLEEHIFEHGTEGTDWRRGISHAYDKYEGRSFKEEAKELTCDIEDWLDH